MRVAIIQPYFFPYAGYFRLFALADIVVIFDCVQFPRRGWVHRNCWNTPDNKTQWFTLPLTKQPVNTQINQLQFHPDATALWQAQLAIIKQHLPVENLPELFERISQLDSTPLKTIINSIKHCLRQFSLTPQLVYSSELPISKSFKGQDKIINICQSLGADSYLNLAGGKHLYDEETFNNHKLKLEFLSEYQGSFESVLARLFKEPTAQIVQEMSNKDNLDLQAA